MWRSLRAWALVVTLLVAACGGDDAEPENPIPPASGSDTPLNAVQDLVRAVTEPDFAEASRLAMPGHAALAALAEGATFAEVARALQEGDEEVAANFWAGFAQGTGAFLSGSTAAAEDGTVTQDDVEFHRIVVEPSEGETRTLLVREDDGYRVDLFASFGAGLADKMITPAERLLSAQTEESRLILAELQEIVPSLLVAASLPDATGEASQQILALVEVITRVN
jgi:hypothetical protein